MLWFDSSSLLLCPLLSLFHSLESSLLQADLLDDISGCGEVCKGFLPKITLEDMCGGTCLLLFFFLLFFFHFFLLFSPFDADTVTTYFTHVLQALSNHLVTAVITYATRCSMVWQVMLG